MRIRQPIPSGLRIGLGVASVVLLIVLYAWLAEQRQSRRRQAATENVAAVQERMQAISSEITALQDPQGADADESARLQAERERLTVVRSRLEQEAETVVDRSVPTWSMLYHEGLLRVLRPQGLRRDEYWLWTDLWATAGRLVAGLAVGVVLSVGLGILMGCATPVEAFCVPPLAFLAKIPPTAMLAVFFVLVGTTFKMYITMIAFGTLPTLAQVVYQSAKKDVPDELIYKAYTLGAHYTELIYNVIYKQILPRLIDAIRLSVGPAMVLLVAAEWMVAGEGFGYRLRLFYQRTDMTVVYVYLILLGLAGLLIDMGLTRFRRWLCPWFGE